VDVVRIISSHIPEKKIHRFMAFMIGISTF
jgi:hypothetical protein